MGGRRVGGLKTRVGRERYIGREGARLIGLKSGGIQAEGVRRRRHNVR